MKSWLRSLTGNKDVEFNAVGDGARLFIMLLPIEMQERTVRCAPYIFMDADIAGAGAFQAENG